MNACRFDVFHQSTDHDCALVIAEGIHVHLNGVLQVLVDEHRMIRLNLNGFIHVAVQLVLVIDNFHGATTQDVRGADHNWIADCFGDCPGFRFTACKAIAWLTNVQLSKNGFELFTVFGKIDRFRSRSPNLRAGGLPLRCFEPSQ